jgi:hypothetical protein
VKDANEAPLGTYQYAWLDEHGRHHEDVFALGAKPSGRLTVAAIKHTGAPGSTVILGQPLAPATTCAACPSTLVTRVELLGGVCQECLEAEARRHREETGGWVAPNVRDLQKRVLDRVAKTAPEV